MNQFKHWFVCLDLSRMDKVLKGYVQFLSEVIKPDTISFLHVIESSSVAEEMVELFPELENASDFKEVIRKELTGKINNLFEDSGIETRLIIKEGRPTQSIIKLLDAMDPDLLVMGKKKEYVGEGVIARRIVKYAPCSVLFVPESSRYALENILSPVDFSEISAEALKTASLLTEPAGGQVLGQHIYKYPSHFFPYMPKDEDKEKLVAHIREKESGFREEFDVPDHIPVRLTLHHKGRMMDEIYDEAVNNRADMIMAGSKASKKLSSLLREDFTDKMVYYSFGIPLLILKNKTKNRKFFDVLMEEQ